MKKIKCQKGFTALEIVLVVVVIGLLSGVGYYVYSQQTAPEDVTSTNQEAPAKTEDEKPAAEVITTLYENKTVGFSFSYPKDWTKALDDKDEYFSANIQLKSPDLKLIPDHPFGVSEAGGIFRVQIGKAEYKDTETTKANNPYSVNPYSVKIAGIDAVREDKCGHPIQDSTCVYFVRNGLYYSLSYRRSDKETSDTAKYKAEFEALLASFKFL